MVEEAAVLHRDRTTGSEKLLDHKHTTHNNNSYVRSWILVFFPELRNTLKTQNDTLRHVYMCKTETLSTK